MRTSFGPLHFLALALAIGLAWTLPAGGSAPAVADDVSPEGRAALRKAVLDKLRKSDAATRREAMGALNGCRDHTPGALVALEAAIVADENVRKAEAARDAQAKTMFAYYRKRFLTRSEPSEQEWNDYEAMERANHDLCDLIDTAVTQLQVVQSHATTHGNALGVAAPDAPAYAESVRAILKSAKTATGRAAVLDGLAGPRRELLADDLVAIAVAPKAERTERVAALAALDGFVDGPRASLLRTAAESPDPYVRRAAFAALTVTPSKDAIDILVERVAREVGVPQDELVEVLTRATGRRLGASGPAWTQWWAAARETWEPSVATDATPDAPTEGKTKFFGLDVRSARVLFVLDRSWSMEAGTLYDGKNDLSIFSGETKIDVARRELQQAIRNLPDGASFNVIGYGTNTKTYAAKLVAATADERNKGCTWVEKLDLEGSTNLGGALIEAFQSLAGGPNAKDIEIADTLVVLTDGVPNCGPIAKPDDVLNEIRRLNSRKSVKIHTVYLGSEGDAAFMKALATQNGGQFVHYVK
ncbi:MAG: VWA domain-containing protein [Planctomycetes bacterium]|nr:VWA domain-containing protein [Planctomycetota bacterium]